MATVQPRPFEFSDGSKLRPIELSETSREFLKVTQQIDDLITRAAIKYKPCDPRFCAECAEAEWR
jgi:hypothetical protein